MLEMEEEAIDDCIALGKKWTIYNFSCWNGDIHDPVLTTEDSWLFNEMGLTIELYPRGVSGREEQLVVRLIVECEKTFKGDLSFIASDGSLLCTRQFDDIEFSEGVLEFPPGPKFRDVVEHITKHEALHKDQLTLQFRFRHPEEETEENSLIHIKSMIETFETTVKILSEQLKGRKQLEDRKGGYIMEYSLNDGEIVELFFIIKDSETAAETMEMRLEVKTFENNFAVRTFWSLLNSEGSVLRSEQNEHAFRVKEDWVISNSLTKGEAYQKGYSVVIDFKIIPSNDPKLLSQCIWDHMNELEVIPTKHSFPHVPIPNSPTSGSMFRTGDVYESDLVFYFNRCSDTLLKCENVTIPVNKLILSTQSPVFETMLSTTEYGDLMDITDLDLSTLGLFLWYLFSGDVEEDLQSDRALKLYYAADKYQVPSLKKKCADFLRDNVCDILSRAHIHEDDQLMSVSHTYQPCLARTKIRRGIMAKRGEIWVAFVVFHGKERKISEYWGAIYP